MYVRRCYIPNCSASAMELVVDLRVALEEFFKLSDEVKAEVIEVKGESFKRLHKQGVSTPEEVEQLLARFPGARVDLSIPAGWMTLEPEKELVTLAFDGVHPKDEHFTYWAPIVRHAQRIEFTYCGEPGDELPWEIEMPKEVQRFYAQLVKGDPYEVHFQKAKEWQKLIEELESGRWEEFSLGETSSEKA